jgi:hypothetical protein
LKSLSINSQQSLFFSIGVFCLKELYIVQNGVFESEVFFYKGLGLKYLFIYGMMEMIGRFIVVEEMKFLKP